MVQRHTTTIIITVGIVIHCRCRRRHHQHHHLLLLLLHITIKITFCTVYCCFPAVLSSTFVRPTLVAQLGEGPVPLPYEGIILPVVTGALGVWMYGRAM